MKPCLLALLTAVCLAAGPAQAQTSAPVPRSAANPAPNRAPKPALAAPAPGPATARPPAPDANSGGVGAYLLVPQDVVEIHVFQEDDLLTTARIGQDGTIKFPLIGTVKIAGKTEDQAAQAIGAGLARDYIINPQVTVKIMEYAQRRYTVLGQVGKPGTYIMPDRASITLFEAVGNAGGFTRIAKLSDITVKRIVDGKDMTYKLSAEGTASDRRATSFEVKPNDIINVPETFF